MEQQEEAKKKNEREGTNPKGYAGHCKLNSDKLILIFFVQMSYNYFTFFLYTFF